MRRRKSSAGGADRLGRAAGTSGAGRQIFWQRQRTGRDVGAPLLRRGGSVNTLPRQIAGKYQLIVDMVAKEKAGQTTYDTATSARSSSRWMARNCSARITVCRTGWSIITNSIKTGEAAITSLPSN